MNEYALLTRRTGSMKLGCRQPARVLFVVKGSDSEMPLVSTKDMLLDAQRKGYAIGAFNANNLEMAQGIVRAAELEEAPVIVQVSQGGAEHAGVEEMAAIVQVLAKKTRIPVALHSGSRGGLCL